MIKSSLSSVDKEIENSYISPRAIKIYLGILNCPNFLTEKLISLLINLSVLKSQEIKNKFLNSGIVRLILGYFNYTLPNHFESNLVSFLVNIANSITENVEQDLIKKMMEIFIKLAYHSNEEIAKECLIGISNLTNLQSILLKKLVLHTDLIPKLYIVTETKLNLIQVTLRITGNLVQGDSIIIHKMLEFGALNFLKNMLFSKINSFKIEALWALSNIITSINIACIDCSFINIVADLSLESDISVVKESILTLLYWLIKTECKENQTKQNMVIITIVAIINFFKNSNDYETIKTAFRALIHISQIDDNKTQFLNQTFKNLNSVAVMRDLFSKSLDNENEQLVQKFLEVFDN